MAQLVYVHGSGHIYESFRDQLAAFQGSDAVSLPGHPEGRALTSVADGAVWLSKYLRWKGAGTAIVAGNSLGGAIAIEWALSYPSNVAGLILLGTGGRLKVNPKIFDMIDNDWPGCVDSLVDYSVSGIASTELRQRLRDWHLTVGQASTRQDYANCNEFDAMDRLHGIHAPTLIVVGVDDQLTPVKYAKFLNERIAGSQLEIVDGAGHMAHAEQPSTVNRLIQARFGEMLG
jgi:pimeloyl-ACP methyl ester carboxylesterase